MSILQIVLPIFLIILAGFALKRCKVAEDSWVHVLNGFVYYVSLPAVIIVSFWQINLGDAGVLKIIWLNTLCMAIFAALLVVILTFVKMDKKLKVAFFMCAFVGNTVYMGFPIVVRAYSQPLASYGIGAATLQLVLGIVFAVLSVEFFIAKSRSFLVYAKDFATHPLMVSLAVGILLSLLKTGGPVLEPVQRALTMLGATASPVALFALGAFMEGKFHKAHFSASSTAAVVKVLIFPLAMFYLIKLFAPAQPHFSAITAVVSSVPAAVTCFVIAEKYKLDKSFVANTILMSTIFSLFSISLFLAMFAK